MMIQEKVVKYYFDKINEIMPIITDSFYIILTCVMKLEMCDEVAFYSL